jgi:hypothetical protein
MFNIFPQMVQSSCRSPFCVLCFHTCNLHLAKRSSLSITKWRIIWFSANNFKRLLLTDHILDLTVRSLTLEEFKKPLETCLFSLQNDDYIIHKKVFRKKKDFNKLLRFLLSPVPTTCFQLSLDEAWQTLHAKIAGTISNDKKVWKLLDL